jgi:hypothetical protein
MAEGAKLRWNTDPLWGLLLAVAALGINVGFFVSSPIEASLPWVSVLLAGLALVFVVKGFRRAFVQPDLYGGKALSVVLCLLTLAAAGLSAFAFYGARKLPGAADAPQAGQKAPDFTLSDTNGKPVSLDSLFAPVDSTVAAPKAVLLIFYRGYW